MNRWYVLRFTTNRFKAVEGFLLLNHVTYFCPMRHDYVLRSDKVCSMRKRLTPAFPGYLFVHIDFETTHPENLSAFRHIYGLVSFGKEPMPVTQLTIDAMNTWSWDAESISSSSKKTIPHRFAEILLISDPLKRSVSLLNYLIENHSSSLNEVKYASLLKNLNSAILINRVQRQSIYVTARNRNSSDSQSAHISADINCK